jgi:cyclopropane-fatty-acyl-phospholipid synthase
MLNKLLEIYLNSRLDFPASFKQLVTNTIVEVDHHICVLLGGNYSPGASESEEIAECSLDLMAVHYDQPLHIFESILGDTMKYSMGLWESGASTLKEAQEAMMADLCTKMAIKDGYNILDIGCGFGSFSAYILKNYPNCTVTGLNLSQVQADYIRDMQEDPAHPLHGRCFKLVQEDFNTVRLKEKFDRIVSIGVWEHISNLDKAQGRVREFLHEDGKVFLHYIVYFEGLARMTRHPLQNTFISKHIFPAGRIWAVDDLVRHQNDLVIEKVWQLNGSNYERTMLCWLNNLRHNMSTLKDKGVDDREIKLWEFYLCLCVAIFHVNHGKYYGNAQYLLNPCIGNYTPQYTPSSPFHKVSDWTIGTRNLHQRSECVAKGC